jgi:ribose transport system ATP-binding protein
MVERSRSEYLIELKNIYKGLYDTNGITINKNIVVLNNVSFNVKRGEVHVLLGENGAGKSTLMKILSGAIHADSGEIFIEGKEEHLQNPHIAHMLGVGIVTQEFSLCPNRSVAQNVFLGREPRKKFLNLVDLTELKKEAQRILSMLKVDLDLNKLVGNLTTAQQQLVEIAKALSLNLKALILDEPTSSLADDQIIQLFKVIRNLKDQKVGIIYISHRLKEVLQIGDRITVLRDGQSVGTKDIKDVNFDEIVQMMIGRKISNMFQRVTKKVGETALEVKNLSKGNEFKNINIYVKCGEIVGLAGIIGAGRTELAQALFGVEKFDSGEVIIFKNVIKSSSPIKSINLRLGLLPEDRRSQGVIPLMSVAENMNLIAMNYIYKQLWVNKRNMLNNFIQYVKDFDMVVASSNQEARYLSGGNQQKLVLAKWLSAKSRIFIFDEPTRGIDVGAKANIYTLINELANQGAAIIIISSELPEIMGLSDRIYVMYKGRIVIEIENKTATEEEILSYSLGGYEMKRKKFQ